MGLADIEDIANAPADQPFAALFLAGFRIFVLVGCKPRGNDLDGLLTLLDVAIELFLGAKAGNTGCIRSLHHDEHDVIEGVAVEPGHRFEVLAEAV